MDAGFEHGRADASGAGQVGAAAMVARAWQLQISDASQSLLLAQQAHDLALAQGDSVEAAHAAVVMALFEARHGDMDQADQRLSALATAFEQQGDRRHWLRAQFGRTIAQRRSGHSDMALAHGAPLMAEVDRSGDLFERALWHNTLGALHLYCGQFDDAITHYFSALELVRDQDFHGLHVTVLSNIGDAQHHYGNDEGAVVYLHEAHQRVLQNGLGWMAPLIVGNLAMCQLGAGDKDRALATIRTLLVAGGESPQSQAAALVGSNPAFLLTVAAQVYAAQPDWTRAEAFLQLARARAAGVSDLGLEIKLCVTQGQIECARGQAREGLQAFERAMRLLDSAPAAPAQDRVQTQAGLAKAHEMLGDWQSAYQCLVRHGQAMDRLHMRAIHASMQTAQVYADLARAESERDHARLKIAEAERERAYTDALTRLPNWEKTCLDGDALLGNGLSPLVLVLDINRFKAINDALGHAFGDAILVETARRLGTLPNALAGRLHANQFCVVSRHPDKEAELRAQIEACFESPLQVLGETVDIDFSVGLARAPLHGQTMLQLIRNAAVAANAAQRMRVDWLVYSFDMTTARRADLKLLSELKNAVDQGELRLYLQPKIALRDGRVTSAEALVRWQHPVRGLLAPSEFVPFAEQAGRIGALTLWMLREAMRVAAELAAVGVALQISVNVSIHDLRAHDFVAQTLAMLKGLHADPATLCLEITESSVMDDPGSTLAVLQALRDAGFSLAVDDFGTGYSSLAYLQKMPVSELKIDRAFVSGVQAGSDAEALLDSITTLGHRLGLRVVAEGVETAAEWALVRNLGCDCAQGWVAARAMPVAEFLQWYRQNDPFVGPAPLQH